MPLPRGLLRLALLLAAGPICAGEDSLSQEEFAKLHREIIPAGRDAWERIPWRVDILAARDQAARENKPLFIWSLSGHPLGCS